MKETIAAFGKNRSLIGIVTHPENGSSAHLPAVILLNSGLLHRVGPNRLYVKMARTLAEQGFVVFRFDFSGIGDSRKSDDDISFDERASNELDDAMEYLGSVNPSDKFVLIGICSGARIAYKTQCNDTRVVASAPINNPKLLDITDDALASAVEDRIETNYRLKSSLIDPGSWLKLFSGRADYRGVLRSLKFLLRKLAPVARKEYPDTQRIKSDIRSITDRNARLLLIYSARDPGLDYLREILGGDLNTWNESGRFQVESIKANHTFTLLKSQRQLIELVANWLDSSFVEHQVKSS
jgi:pimeloyl-ACP methyl ester carboxylesterase